MAKVSQFNDCIALLTQIPLQTETFCLDLTKLQTNTCFYLVHLETVIVSFFIWVFWRVRSELQNQNVSMEEEVSGLAAARLFFICGSP